MVKIFVGKLSDDVTSEDLRSLFEQAGTVDSADRVHGKDIGFVHMPNEKEALLAVRYSYSKFYIRRPFTTALYHFPINFSPPSFKYVLS